MIFAENPLGWLWVQQKILWGTLRAQRKIFGAFLGRKLEILWGALGAQRKIFGRSWGGNEVFFGAQNTIFGARPLLPDVCPKKKNR